MTRQRGTWGAVLAAALGLVLLAGCGGDAEQERIDLLMSDPGASFRLTCDVFLAHVEERSGWSVVGASETEFGVATEETVGSTDFAEGSHVGLLKVVLANEEKKETPFRFVFVSVPVYGGWMLRRVGALDASGQVQIFGGDHDVFYGISADQCRHPTHPDFIGP